MARKSFVGIARGHILVSLSCVQCSTGLLFGTTVQFGSGWLAGLVGWPPRHSPVCRSERQYKVRVDLVEVEMASLQ